MKPGVTGKAYCFSVCDRCVRGLRGRVVVLALSSSREKLRSRAFHEQYRTIEFSSRNEGSAVMRNWSSFVLAVLMLLPVSGALARFVPKSTEARTARILACYNSGHETVQQMRNGGVHVRH